MRNSNPLVYFEEITDPRSDHTKLYSLESIIFLTLSAVLSGCNHFTEIAEFGIAKQDWLSKYVDVSNGTPSHDTLGDFFKRLNPKEFEKVFIRWTEAVRKLTDGELIALDGKRLRGSYNTETSKSAIHMVSAWATDNELVLGQIRTNDKSNEITAIPDLLDTLELKGAIVSIDAMGCQTDIARKIRDKKADYILALKGNQSSFQEQVISQFARVRPETVFEEIDKGHGRIETRKYSVIHELRFIDDADDWESLSSLVRVESTRDELSKGKASSETRYYISSKKADAEYFSQKIRQHWHIENKLHWTLDVTFNEDRSRVRTGFADENFSIIRRAVINLVKQNKPEKLGISMCRSKCAWDDKFREGILQI
jgi:predicted transposase YbfD/YdcC